MATKPIKVAIPAKYQIRSVDHSGKVHTFTSRQLTAMLREHKISYDTNRGFMFFDTEEEATLFKLTYL